MSSPDTIPFPTLGGTPPFRAQTFGPGTVPFPSLEGTPRTPPFRPQLERSNTFRHVRSPPIRPTLRTRSESIISMIDDPLTAQASDVFSASSASPRSLPARPARKLYAIGDIHLSFKPNRIAWEDLRPHPLDGLILVGDVGETKEHCEMAFQKAKSCFHTVFWCPGNHELYTLATHKNGARGVAKYQECIDAARLHGVLTPGRL
jgi:hypothetical protein